MVQMCQIICPYICLFRILISDFLIKTLQGYMSVTLHLTFYNYCLVAGVKFSSQLAEQRVEVGCVNMKGGVGVVGCVA